MNKRFSKVIKNNKLENFISNEINIAIAVFVVCSLIVLSITGFWDLYDKKFFENILVEAHGMLFDVLIIGIIILWLNKKREKKLEIKRYHDEIDDFRFWKSDEAMYRIMGNIKRLQRLKVNKIDLQSCYLKNSLLFDITINNSNLSNVCLEGSNCSGANFQECDLTGAVFLGGNFINTNFKCSDLRNANFESANLHKSNFEQANLEGAYLHKAGIREANLENSNLSFIKLINAKLTKSNLKNAILDDANLMGADLREVRNLNVEQLLKVQTLYKTKLDNKLGKEIKERFPELLEESKSALL